MSRLTQWLFDKTPRQQGNILAALDIGSSKIACLIAREDGEGCLKVIGSGLRLSEGVKCGVISDMKAVRDTIVETVEAAEQMTEERIEQVVVNMPATLLLSQSVEVSMPVNGREISSSDIIRIMEQGQTLTEDDPQGNMSEFIHTIPVRYVLDGQHGIRDPHGMTGNHLQTRLHYVSASFGPMQTLMAAVAKSHLEAVRIMSSPYACGASCLVDDEMELGCAIIDMGAGTTSVGVFFDGKMAFNSGIAIGGAHITNDIARVLTTTLEQAERVKTLFGGAIAGPADDREMIDVPLVGEDGPDNLNHVPKSHVIRIIQPRLEEIFEMIRAKLEGSGLSEEAGRRVVLTGGASQMPGVREVAQRVLEKNVRIGKPIRLAKNTPISSKNLSESGMDERTSGPVFSTAVGMLALYSQPEILPSFGGDFSGPSLSSRISQWFRQNV